MQFICQSRKSPFTFFFLLGAWTLCLGTFPTVWAQTQTSHQLTWASEQEWHLALYAQTPQNGTEAVSLIEFWVPYEDSRINQTTQTRTFTTPYWFDPDGLCQVYVAIDTIAQVISIRCVRPTNSPLAGEGLTCFAKGGGTTVILDDVHIRQGAEKAILIFDSYQQMLWGEHLPSEGGYICIVDLNGRVLHSQHFAADQRRVKLKLSHLPTGRVYVAQIWTGSRLIAQLKFVR